jgi:hypothetical protein
MRRDRPDAERPDLAIEVIWTSGGVGKLDHRCRQRASDA